jgi:hypothetical protein
MGSAVRYVLYLRYQGDGIQKYHSAAVPKVGTTTYWFRSQTIMIRKNHEKSE